MQLSFHCCDGNLCQIRICFHVQGSTHALALSTAFETLENQRLKKEPFLPSSRSRMAFFTSNRWKRRKIFLSIMYASLHDTALVVRWWPNTGGGLLPLPHFPSLSGILGASSCTQSRRGYILMLHIAQHMIPAVAPTADVSQCDNLLLYTAN